LFDGTAGCRLSCTQFLFTGITAGPVFPPGDNNSDGRSKKVWDMILFAESFPYWRYSGMLKKSGGRVTYIQIL
jgi:hypothetical protein